ncbi:DUF192 domain-containing protein [Roseovarius sp. A21]|uniref:DUF192 domain-containing protein n=1 Tax=Roseovarius bejariae TaxID=2576383 RepID=A0A844CFJ1_9RHOB|nr:DUF192 domain-containing protein [Roseovarius bejariae]MRU14021.1 DUF192 domain-containing protein [Roseovarius bejariae]
MGNSRKTKIGLTAGIVLLLSSVQVFAGECREDRAILRGDWGQAQFTIEVADDNAERSKGLMNRESMPKSAGMLFVYPRPKTVGFWMKNTLIPLDMIFMDRTGTVQHIHHQAQPGDLRPKFGGDNIQYVLEINGGLAEQMGIAPGTQLRHPTIPEDRAAWPC